MGGNATRRGGIRNPWGPWGRGLNGMGPDQPSFWKTGSANGGIGEMRHYVDIEFKRGVLQCDHNWDETRRVIWCPIVCVVASQRHTRGLGSMEGMDILRPLNPCTWVIEAQGKGLQKDLEKRNMQKKETYALYCMYCMYCYICTVEHEYARLCKSGGCNDREGIWRGIAKSNNKEQNKQKNEHI